MPKFVGTSPPVLEKIFENYLPYMDMAAILVMRPGLFMYTLVLPSYRCSISNLALIGPAVSEEKIFEYFGNIHVYCSRVGADQPLGPFFFRLINLHLPISFKFFSSNDILTIFTIQMHGPPMLTLS